MQEAIETVTRGSRYVNALKKWSGRPEADEAEIPTPLRLYGEHVQHKMCAVYISTSVKKEHILMNVPRRLSDFTQESKTLARLMSEPHE